MPCACVCAQMRFVSTHSNVRGITAIAVSGNKKYFACVETVSDDKPQQVSFDFNITTLSIHNPPFMCQRKISYGNDQANPKPSMRGLICVSFRQICGALCWPNAA